MCWRNDLLGGVVWTASDDALLRDHLDDWLKDAAEPLVALNTCKGREYAMCVSTRTPRSDTSASTLCSRATAGPLPDAGRRVIRGGHAAGRGAGALERGHAEGYRGRGHRHPGREEAGETRRFYEFLLGESPRLMERWRDVRERAASGQDIGDRDGTQRDSREDPAPFALGASVVTFWIIALYGRAKVGEFPGYPF